MHRRFSIFLSAVGSLLIAVPIAQLRCSAQAAQTAGPNALTLDQVIAAADARYPAIQAARAQQKAARVAIAVAKTAYLPRADLLWQTNRATANNILGLLLPQAVIPSVTGPVLPSDPARSAWNSAGGALLSWQPFDFGVRGAKVEVARQGNEAAKQAAALTELQICASAGSAFFDLAAAQQLAVAAQANVRRYEAFDKVVRVLVENSLRPGADASQADAQLALARNQLIQMQTQVTGRRSVLAEYLQTAQSQVEVDASELLRSPPPANLQSTKAASHPAVLEEHALTLQQEAQKRVLERSYAPVFSTSGMIFGRGAGTNASGSFPGGTAGLGPNVLNWGAGIQVSFAAFDFFTLRDQSKVQKANVEAEHARYQQSISDVTNALEQAQAALDGARKFAANTPIELAAAQTSEQKH